MKRKVSIKQTAKSIEYHKENIKQINFALNRQYDQDIIEHLESIPNRNAYLKNLVREDMKRSK